MAQRSSFYDPVCGSGTICIEAALIGHNIAPGFNRSFTCETWDWVDPAIFEKVRNEAEAKADYDVELDICGSDVDGRMIEVARANAEEVGLGDSITFKQLALKDFTTEKEYGVMVANPPYGERLGEEESVRRLYKEMGHVFRPLTTWSKYILTSDLAFEEYYGAKATKNGSFTTEPYEQIYSNTGEHVHQENHGKTKKAGVKMKEAVFLQEVKEIQLLKNALTLLDWDSSTGMPEKVVLFEEK